MNRNVYATILIILAIGLYFTVTQGVIDDAKKIKTANAEYVKAIESAKHLISVRDQILNDYKSISEEDRNNLTKIIPKSVDNIRLIIDLNQVALQRGFSLRDIKASAEAAEPGKSSNYSNNENQNVIPAPVLDKVTVTFSVNAPYQQFISFLQDLESSLRILDVSHLSVSADDKGVYDWNVELQTYWLRSQ